jgi:hypothetical protein
MFQEECLSHVPNGHTWPEISQGRQVKSSLSRCQSAVVRSELLEVFLRALLNHMFLWYGAAPHFSWSRIAIVTIVIVAISKAVLSELKSDK